MRGKRGPTWWAANASLWICSAVFLLPFLWLLLTALKPVEQTMQFQWLPKGYRAPIDGAPQQVIKERQLTEDSAIIVVQEGPRKGRRILIPASSWDGERALVEEQQADQIRKVRREADLEQEVPAGWWRVREKFLRKYADRQPRWTCVPEDKIEESVRLWWENFRLAVEYLSDTEEVALAAEGSIARSEKSLLGTSTRHQMIELSWQQQGALRLTRYDTLSFRSHAEGDAGMYVSALTRDGRGGEQAEGYVLPQGVQDHEIPLKALCRSPNLRKCGWVTRLWLNVADDRGQSVHISEAKLIHYRATFWTYLGNTLIVALLGALGTVLSSSLVAYGFSRLRWPGRDKIFWLVLSTMMVPFPVIMIPMFAVFRELGWVGTLKPLWVPAFFGSAFNIFLLRQFFLTIPQELSDAARIDGCSEFGIYWRIVLPLSKPALAVVALFHFLYAWNDFMGPLIYLTRPETFTLSLALQFYQSQHGGSEWHLLMAMSVLILLPIVALFFFTQKTFIQGIATTGMKG